MAFGFIDAFNKAFQKITSKVMGILPKRKPKPKKPKPWQQSRRELERSKKRIETSAERIPQEPEPDFLEPDDMPAFPKIAPENVEAARIMTRGREFDMLIDEDPAFMAWINRVGGEAGIPVDPRLGVTQSRLDYLVELFGVEDPLALYEYITNDPDFGYGEFQEAYDIDGKNKTPGGEGAYRINNAISMHMMQVELFEKFPIYELVTS